MQASSDASALKIDSFALFSGIWQLTNLANVLHVSVEMEPASGGASKWEVVFEMNVFAKAQGDLLCEFELNGYA